MKAMRRAAKSLLSFLNRKVLDLASTVDLSESVAAAEFGPALGLA